MERKVKGQGKPAVHINTVTITNTMAYQSRSTAALTNTTDDSGGNVWEQTLLWVE